MVVDPAEHIGGPGFGVDVVELCGRDEGVDRRRPFAAPVATAEGPIPASDGDAAQRALGRIVGEADAAVFRDYQHAGVVPTADDAFNFSMWRGYLSDPYHSEALKWCEAAGAEIAYIHTSGHASAADLCAFAAGVRPKIVVPVHGIKWDEESHDFGTVRRLGDGEAMMIP
jgi:ribonuclease J